LIVIIPSMAFSIMELNSAALFIEANVDFLRHQWPI
jgi:hypothetical protein